MLGRPEPRFEILDAQMISNPRHGSPPRLMAHQPTRCSTTQESSIRVHRPDPVSGVYAHSLPDRSIGDWELLLDHAAAVGERAACFAEPFGWAEAARIAGVLHDIGKLTADFQAYIRGERSSGGDHGTKSARWREGCGTREGGPG